MPMPVDLHMQSTTRTCLRHLRIALIFQVKPLGLDPARIRSKLPRADLDEQPQSKMPSWSCYERQNDHMQRPSTHQRVAISVHRQDWP